MGLVPHCHQKFEKGEFWKDYLGDKTYYFSGLMLVDLKVFRMKGHGNIIRGYYKMLEFEG